MHHHLLLPCELYASNPIRPHLVWRNSACDPVVPRRWIQVQAESCAAAVILAALLSGDIVPGLWTVIGMAREVRRKRLVVVMEKFCPLFCGYFFD
ncbi:MAG: hypothetical protein DMG69_03915 [Acidobacteria bacterium]|nr:MAG: hypothetical protein DMG69_03915 [Acidobacteriota bacterium]